MMTLNILFLQTSCGPSKPISKEATLRLNLTDDPVSLDPRVVRSLKDLTVVKQLFEGLMRLDQEGVPQPAVAEIVTRSPDLLSYTFHLRKTFWTNGEPVTAYDFEYAWKKVLDPHFASDYAYMLYPIKNARSSLAGTCSADQIGVRAVDEQTLLVDLEAPTPYFLELLAFPTYFPVNKEVDRQSKNWSAAPGGQFVSNGPFQLDTWLPQFELILRKNPSYWEADSVHLDRILFTVIQDNHTECTLFEKEELDWMGQPISHNLSPEMLGQMKQEGRAYSYPVAGTFWFKFNTDQAPFNSAKIRRAFAYAINRQAIIQHILQGNQAPATGPLPPSMSLNHDPYFEDNNISLAKQLFEEALAENGWTKESFPHVSLHYPPSERNSKIVQLVQEQWKNAFGVVVSLEAVEGHLYRRQLRMGLFQVGTGDWIADFNDPLAFLELFKYKNDDAGNRINDTGWYDAEYAHLLELSLKETDPQKRCSLLHQAEQLFVDGMPVAPVYHYAFDYVKKEYVKDVVLSPLGMADFKQARIN